MAQEVSLTTRESSAPELGPISTTLAASSSSSVFGQAFYAERLSWDGAGKAVVDAKTSEQAIEMAGLDWEVDMSPVTLQGHNAPIPNFEAVYRTDTNAVLGMSRGRYTPLQNKEMFDWTDALVQDGTAKYVAAGSFMGGKKVWLMMEMVEGMTIAGEPYRPFLMATTGHDMDTAFRAFTTVMRVYCLNTYYMALRSQDNGVRIHHHSKIHERMEFAHEQMRILDDKQRRLQEWLEQAAAKTIGSRVYPKLEAAVFGEIDQESSAQRRKVQETFQEIWGHESQINGANGYSFFNAVTGYADHALRNQGKADIALQSERRMMSQMSGSSNDLKNRAIHGLVEVARLPEPEFL